MRCSGRGCIDPTAPSRGSQRHPATSPGVEGQVTEPEGIDERQARPIEGDDQEARGAAR